MTQRAEQPGDLGGRVLVAGSINMDLVVTAPHRPRVGETVIGGALDRFPGGKGSNQAVAAAAADAPVEFIGLVGDDDAGAELRAFLAGRGVGVRHLGSLPGENSGLAIVLVADGDNSVVVVSGANARFGPAALDGVAIEPGDVLVSQFEIEEETVRSFFARGKEAGARTVLNPSPVRQLGEELWELSDVVVVNELELEALRRIWGLPATGEPEPESLIRREGQMAVVTLGARGCLVAAGEEVVRIPGREVEPLDTTGAGDCFLGFVAARLLYGDDLLTAARVANVASSLCIQRLGAGSSMPSAEEVAAALRPQ